MAKENEGQPSEPGKQEQEPTVVCRAARFNGERPAGKAYSQAQKAIYRADCDVSVYRMQIDRVWHVAALGISIPEDLDHRLQAILVSGEPATLEPGLVKMLWDRHVQAAKKAPWIERHYR